MSEGTEKINIIELLMEIKEDVSSIKTDIANFKEAQKLERESIAKDISDVRTDYRRDLLDLESKLMSKFNSMQSVQNNLVGDVDTLKQMKDAKDAKKWRTVVAFIATSIGSMLLVKLPEFIGFWLSSFSAGGK